MPRRADVFFYGIFMDLDQLRAKGFAPEGAELASVAGFAVRVGRRAALVPDASARAYGVVTSLALDEIRGLYSEPSLQAYRPVAVLARLEDGGVIPALCYNLPTPPSAAEHDPEYAARLRTAATKVGLPAAYVESLP